MAMKGRSILALAVFLMLGAVVALGSWYETQRVKRPAPATEKSVTVHVTNAGDRGPGSLREALFLVAGATGPTSISIEVPTYQTRNALARVRQLP
jgi:hypothetical protein